MSRKLDGKWSRVFDFDKRHGGVGDVSINATVVAKIMVALGFKQKIPIVRESSLINHRNVYN